MENTHPCHKENLPRMNRIAGQVEGVKRMIEEGRYCPDILAQLKAIRSAIKAVEGNILQKHLEHCVAQAFAKGADCDGKIAELRKIFEKYDA